MSLFNRLGPRTERRVNQTNLIPERPIAGSTYSAEQVTPTRAFTLSAWYRGVNLLADTVSDFPANVYRSRDAGVAPIASPQVVSSPSALVTSTAWARQVMVSWLVRGDAYLEVCAIDGRGYPTQVEALNPDEFIWQPNINQPGRFELWRYQPNGRSYRVDPWPLSPIIHSAGLPIPGVPFGLSPIAAAAESLGLGLALKKFGAQWFGQGAHPSAILSSTLPVDGETARILKERFVASVNGREPVVLGSGASYTPIQIAPEESQFLQTSGANDTDVARFLGIPAALIDAPSGSSMTYSNREQRSLDFLTYTVKPWMTRLEDLWSSMLPKPQFVKLDPSALLKVDLETQARVADFLMRAGIETSNEERPKWGLPAHDSGDRLNWPPFNVTPAAPAAPVPAP